MLFRSQSHPCFFRIFSPALFPPPHPCKNSCPRVPAKLRSIGSPPRPPEPNALSVEPLLLPPSLNARSSEPLRIPISTRPQPFLLLPSPSRRPDHRALQLPFFPSVIPNAGSPLQPLFTRQSRPDRPTPFLLLLAPLLPAGLADRLPPPASVIAPPQLPHPVRFSESLLPEAEHPLATPACNPAPQPAAPC